MKESLQEMVDQFNTSDDQINHWLPRFYSLYIDGSYSNEQDYKKNIKELNIIKKSTQMTGLLNSFIYKNFFAFLRAENFIESDQEIAKILEQNKMLLECLKERTFDLVDSLNS